MLNENIVYYHGELGKIHRQSDGLYVFQPVGARHYNSATDTHLPFEAFEATDEDNQIYYLKRTFVWGKILNVHQIGNFVIIEGKDRNTGEVSYHIYIDFDDTCRAATTLDEALILALTLKYDGLNSQAGIMFMRMLNMSNKEN